jgi:hypothetical protein
MTEFEAYVKATLSPTLRAASAICKAIRASSDLRASIPVWSDGDQIRVGAHEDRHGRRELIHRAELDLVAGEWHISHARPEVADFLVETLLAHGARVFGHSTAPGERVDIVDGAK